MLIQRFILVVCIFLCLTLQTAFANEQLNISAKHFNINTFSEKIQVLVARPLYDVDTDELPSQLLPLLKDSPAVKLISITENIDNEIILRYYRDEQQQLIFNQNIPESLSKSLKQKTILVSYKNEEVGKIVVYYEKNILNRSLLEANQLNFSNKEKAWLNKKIPIRYVYDPDKAPFEWTNDVGKHAGIVSDILKLIQAKSGLNLVSIKTQTWAEATNIAKNRQADMYSAVSITEDRKRYMNFTEKNFFSTHYVFVSRQGEDYLEGFDAIQNKKIAVVNAHAIQELINKNKPDLPLVVLNGTQDGFDKLQANEIDIFLVNMVTAKYFTRQEKYKTLNIASNNIFGMPYGKKICEILFENSFFRY